MKKLILPVTLLSLLCCYAPSIQNMIIKGNETSTLHKYKNVIVFVGDGMGPNHVDAGGIFKGEPLVFDVVDEKWAYHAYSNTDSLTSEGFTLDTSKSLLKPNLNPSLYDGTPSPYAGASLGTSGDITTYTDSAAGGTALATGVKVTNARIGMDVEGNPVENLVEIAKGLNKKAGVVSSDNIVGATPASFVSHASNRYENDDIINGMANSDIDLILTANTSDFKVTHERLFIENGFDVSYNKESLDKDSDRILGLFSGVVPRKDPRAPTLEELTTFSLDYLDNEDGFFLMVEGAKIDKVSHSHQSKLMLDELLAFDDAVRSAANWASGRDDTLIVVTADHETGALYFDEETATQETIVNDLKWLSANHSRTRVDIAVYGDITPFINKYGDSFGELEGLPYWDNTDVFKLCSSYLAGFK